MGMSPGDLIEIPFTVEGSYIVRRGDYSNDDGELLTDDAILALEREMYEDNWISATEIVDLSQSDVKLTFHGTN